MNLLNANLLILIVSIFSVRFDVLLFLVIRFSKTSNYFIITFQFDDFVNELTFLLTDAS